MEELTDEMLDIMEPGAMLTDEQLQRLDSDAELLEGCEDIFMASRLLAQEQGTVDAEQALEKFHKAHPHSKPEHSVRASVLSARFKYILAAAAVFIGAIVLLMPRKNADENKLAQENSTQQISISNAKGKEMAMNMTTSANQVDRKVVVETVGEDEDYVVNVPYGESLELVLPDSSQVFLHPGSELAYSSGYGKANREVKLKGEAYFVVTKNAACPFIVSTSRSQTTVYGTEFNVTSYSDLSEKVTLVKGSVSVHMRDQQQPVKIQPGQQISLHRTGMISVNAVDTEPFVSWRDGYFYFDNTELSDILKVMGRCYNVGVECHEPQLLKYHMRFIIPRNKDIHYVLEMINRMQKVNAELQGNTILVKTVDD